MLGLQLILWLGEGGAGKEATVNEEEERKNQKLIPGPLQGSVCPCGHA